MSENRILCVNLNAAIDKTIVVDSFRLGAIHRPEAVRSLAGGKGCNVARALHTLGDGALITGWVGGTAGQFIENQLHQEGIPTDFIYTNGESRTCTSILDNSNRVMTEIYEKGEPVSEDKIDEMRTRFAEIVGRFTAVTLSGSLPPGVADDFYAQLIGSARKAGVPAFLDSSSDALRLGASAQPHLIKPNESEIRVLAAQEPASQSDYAAMAGEISRRYDTIVALSLGRDGAMIAQQDRVALIKCPPVAAQSAVGSGDCFLAGLVHGFIQNLDLIESARCGVAAGAANTLTIGAGYFSLNDFDRIYSAITVEDLTAV